MMRTVQMTLDDDLVEAVDAVSRRLGTSRSAFARDALREALRKERVRALEERYRAGYERHPGTAGMRSRNGVNREPRCRLPR